MRAWITTAFAEEESASFIEGKSIVLHGTKQDLLAVADFLKSVAAHLETAEYCHMHLRDHMDDWSKETDIDFEVTVDDRVET